MNRVLESDTDRHAVAGNDAASPVARNRRGSPVAIALGAFGLLLLGAAGGGVWIKSSGTDGGARADVDHQDARRQQLLREKLAAMSVDDAEQIVVEGLEAQQRNAALPLDGSPVEKPAAFTLSSVDENGARTALRCMTQAIYYEAANEPEQGRRAVAQVVLNRVRHPAYPNSVCGVVYQGSYRTTGCQFSFTCDGSLLRAPSVGPWRAAERIAREALAGVIEPSVGTATHYHADYVLPKWAYTLGKIDQIGRHIFYRFRGRPGNHAAFSARYAGLEAIPSLNYAQLRDRIEDERTMLAQDTFTPGLTVAPHITDRHAANDVGGRLDTRTGWQLKIPDPVSASTRLEMAVSQSRSGVGTAPEGRVAIAEAAQPSAVRTAAP